MVARRLQLAQAVCAVYSLSKPQGASRAEIAKFCRKRFGVFCASRVWERLLERAVDEGLLAKFRRRYRLARGSCCILWAGRKGENLHRGVQEGRRKRAPRALQKRRSSLYRLWCEQRRRTKTMKTSQPKSVQQNDPTRTDNKGVHKNKSKAVINKCRKRNRSNRRTNRSSRPTTSKRSCSTQKRHRYNLRSRLPKNRLNLTKGRPKRSNDQLRPPKNRPSRPNNRARRPNDRITYCKSKHEHKTKRVYSKLETTSKRHQKKFLETNRKNTEEREREESHRNVLRQTRAAVAHSKSWDRLNYSRQKGQKENEELVKNCRLVQKILTRPHAASWDDLNYKLRRIKEVRSGQEVGAGAAPSRKIRRSWSKF